MVGIPDGLGAFRQRLRRRSRLLLNHEITQPPRYRPGANRSAGAFVSRWTIDSDTLKGCQGTGPSLPSARHKCFHVRTRSTSAYFPGQHAVAALCSADPRRRSAFFATAGDALSAFSWTARLVADNCRAWARILRPELPRRSLATAHDWVRCLSRTPSLHRGHPPAKTDVVVCTGQTPRSNTAPSALPTVPARSYVYVGRCSAVREHHQTRPG
jgi:hypothetical protein